jgi:pyruvate formate lyase activating enzyme
VLDPEAQPQLSEQYIFSFLENRRGKLEGVVLSGGEPSAHPGLVRFSEKIKALGYLIKIDTNGSNPDTIADAYGKGLVDALGIDYKTTASSYRDVTKCKIDNISERVQKTISYAISNNVTIDTRTTVHKKLHTPEVLMQMREELNSLGVSAWTLQQFHATDIIDDTLTSESTYSDAELIGIARSLGNHTRVRGLKGSFIFNS